jgi:hypothetical protein
MKFMNVRPAKILPQDIADARAGRQGATISLSSTHGRLALCRECFCPISGERITFACAWMPWPMTVAHIHKDEALCLANIESRAARKQVSEVAEPKPQAPKPIVVRWVLDPEEVPLARFAAIPDQRYPRRVTACRVTACRDCGEPILPGQERSVYKLRTEWGWALENGHGDGFIHTSRLICLENMRVQRERGER